LMQAARSVSELRREENVRLTACASTKPRRPRRPTSKTSRNASTNGVIAARSSWRALVTPKPPDGVARRKKSKTCNEEQEASAKGATTPSASTPAPASSPASPQSAPQAEGSPSPANASPSPSLASPSTAPLAPAVPVAYADPTILTVKHWNRIQEGALFASSSRVDWAILMQRTFGVDALKCPKCAAKMRILATLTDPAEVKKILSHLRLRTEPLPRARARDPTGQESFDFEAA
ncbi:MAG: hypothetical protein ACMG6S_16590, partial [Byssovorax sp.]